MHTTKQLLCRPRMYWLDNEHEPLRRVHMHNKLASSNVEHVAVPAHDAYADFAGNVTRANTLSHVRALRCVRKDVPNGQIAYVAENTVSFRYVPYWTTDLRRVVCNAPEDWGVLQLAYICGPATATIVRERKTVSEQRQCMDDPFHVEKSVIKSKQAPYVPWKDICTSGTTFYVVHPRGYTDILKHVYRYKHDPLYSQQKIPRFHPDVDASHLFSLTTTYTFHLPMFSASCIPPTIHYRGGSCWYTEHKKRMDVLVQSWHNKYLKWKAHRKQCQQRHTIKYFTIQ